MPIEVAMLRNAAVALTECPNCHATPFDPFLRGQIQRPRRAWLFGKPRLCYCALICSMCKEIVGYEDPLDARTYELRPKYRHDPAL